MSLDDIADLVEQVKNEFTESECKEELVDAARYGDVDVVRSILHVYPQLHKFQDRHGNTPLHMSSANGHVEVTEVLLKHGAVVTVKNNAGNTPLHWASTNGHDATVQALLMGQQVDVLQQNQFGRSALTEGFTSQNLDVVKSLLNHESACEERLIGATVGKSSDGSQSMETETSTTAENGSSNNIVHQFVFQGIEIETRELAIAESEKDTILGQIDPSDDTTGLGIWASSLVLAQWLVSQIKEKSSWTKSTNLRVVELGAGCGVPSLALAKACASFGSGDQGISNCQIYATDFNPKTVDNLQHNVDINKNGLVGSGVTVEGMMMNWQDSSTWPKEPVDCLIGSDLIYQSDMVPLLIQTITGLLKPGTSESRFLYVARTDGQRQGHSEFLAGMEASNFDRRDIVAPIEYTQSNPLKSQDDDLCFMYFHELQSTQYTLYEFVRRI